MPLTDVKCRNAKGKAGAFKLSDGGGLHLLVNADGAKYWRLAYRWHGKQRTLALGVYPAVGLAEARAARDDAKRSLAASLDPSMVKRERKRAAKVAAGNSIAAIEAAELLDMLRKVEKRGVHETARRLKQLVGQIFRFAIVTGRAKRDP